MNKIDIFLTCRLFDGDAFYFTKPIADIDIVNKVVVFRDKKGIELSKIEYITSAFKRFRKFGFIFRVFQMLLKKTKQLKLIIGIYEIPHGLIAMFIGKILRKPVVVCIIGNPAYTPLRKGLRKKLTYLILRNIKFITTTGNNSRRFLIGEGFPEAKIFILPNSIDINYFKPLEIFKKYDLITIGRISPEKQLNILIEVVYSLKNVFPNIKVGIGGRGPDSEQIKKRIIELELGENIEMLGYVEDNKIVDFFNSGKIFMSCSETEGFPRTVIQAVSCGTPCVVSNVGDMSDLIINDESGFLINDSVDVDSYVEKILELLGNDKKYQDFIKNGLLVVKNKFSHEAASKMWCEIIKTI